MNEQNKLINRLGAVNRYFSKKTLSQLKFLLYLKLSLKMSAAFIQVR